MMKKILALLLAVAMMATLLAGCGNDTKSTAATEAPTEAPVATKSYQLTGIFSEEGEYASMLASAFLLNLNEDGTAVCDKYAYANYDASPAATNSTYSAGYLTGKWKEVEKDGVPCLQIKLEAEGGANAQTAYAYDIAGEYSFDMTFPVVPGASYTRNVTMTGSETKAFADADAFIQANKKEFTAPEHVGTFVDSEKNATAYLQADGTMLVYAGYDKFADGKWMVGADGVSISIGGEAVEVTTDGNTATFTVDRSLDGANSTTYTLVCSDVAALPAAEIAEDAPYTCSIDMGDNATTAELTLGTDGTAVLKVFTDIPCTYTRIGDAVVLEVTGELEGYAAQIWPNVSHAYLLNEDHSMTGVKNVYDAGGLVLVALNDTDMKVMFPSYHMEREGFTYTVSEDGTSMTVTAPGEDVLGAFGQIWTASGAENWKLDGNTATAVTE